MHRTTIILWAISLSEYTFNQSWKHFYSIFPKSSVCASVFCFFSIPNRLLFLVAFAYPPDGWFKLCFAPSIDGKRGKNKYKNLHHCDGILYVFSFLTTFVDLFWFLEHSSFYTFQSIPSFDWVRELAVFFPLSLNMFTSFCCSFTRASNRKNEVFGAYIRLRLTHAHTDRHT